MRSNLMVAERIVISGVDGSGKSTLIKGLLKTYNHTYYWGRYHHYSQKVFNMIMRLTGKSYTEQTAGERHGYHDYYGVIGILYLICSVLDNYVTWFVNYFRFYCFGRTWIIDRYTIDKIVDLHIDGISLRLILTCYSPLVKLEKKFFKIVLIKCDYFTIVSRRNDLNHDRTLDKKIKTYEKLQRIYKIQSIDTSHLSVSESRTELEYQLEAK